VRRDPRLMREIPAQNVIIHLPAHGIVRRIETGTGVRRCSDSRAEGSSQARPSRRALLRAGCFAQADSPRNRNLHRAHGTRRPAAQAAAPDDDAAHRQRARREAAEAPEDLDREPAEVSEMERGCGRTELLGEWLL
jgi:hypothetical protein